MFTRRILVIEDNEENLVLMQLILERAEYEVLLANDGLQGLEIARKEQPDIILLDLAMPEMNGWEVAQNLKNNILTKDIPIIAVTAHSLPRDRTRAIDAGCETIISKPFQVSELIDEIKRVAEW